MQVGKKRCPGTRLFVPIEHLQPDAPYRNFLFLLLPLCPLCPLRLKTLILTAFFSKDRGHGSAVSLQLAIA
jgi:hypothetical protein